MGAKVFTVLFAKSATIWNPVIYLVMNPMVRTVLSNRNYDRVYFPVQESTQGEYARPSREVPATVIPGYQIAVSGKKKKTALQTTLSLTI